MRGLIEAIKECELEYWEDENDEGLFEYVDRILSHRIADPPSAAEVRRAAIAECVAIAIGMCPDRRASYKDAISSNECLAKLELLLDSPPPKSYLDGLRDAQEAAKCRRERRCDDVPEIIQYMIDAEERRMGGIK